MGFQGVGRIVALCLNLITFAVILGALAPAEYGAAALALAIAEIAATVVSLGIDTAVFRGLSVGDIDGAGLGTAAAVKLVLNAAAATIGVLVVLALPDSSARLPLIVAFAWMPTAALLTFQQVLRARVRLLPFGIADVVSSALALAFLLLLSIGGLEAVDVVICTVASNTVVWVALAVVAARDLPPRLPLAGMGSRVRHLIRQSRMLGVGDATVVTYYRADVVALGVTSGGSAVGLYAAAYRFVDIAMYVQTIVIGAFFPRIARSWGDRAALRALLTDLGALLLALATIVFIAVVTLGPTIIELFGGQAYGDVTVLVTLLMAATAAMFLNRLLIQTLVAGGHAARQALCWIGGLVGAVLAFPLSSLYAENGAGIAVLIGEVLILVIAATQLRGFRALPTSPPRGAVLAVVLVAAATAVAILVPDPGRALVGIGLAAAAAGTLAIAIRRRTAMLREAA